MKATVSKLLLVGCVLGSTASPAAGQTGRIAHFSHGGSAVGLGGEAAAADNFGIIPMPLRVEWKADTVSYLSDSVAIHSGLSRTYYRSGEPQTDWHRRPVEIPYAGNKKLLAAPNREWATLDSLHKWYPKAVFIGFNKPKKAGPKKPSGQMHAFPKRPFQYSYWRELAGAAGLGVVGWLLGRKPGAKVG